MKLNKNNLEEYEYLREKQPYKENRTNERKRKKRTKTKKSN